MKNIYFIKGLKFSDIEVIYLIFKTFYDLSKEYRGFFLDYIISIKWNIRIIKFKNLIHSILEYFLNMTLSMVGLDLKKKKKKKKKKKNFKPSYSSSQSPM